MCKSMLPLALVMAATIALAGFARPAPDVSDETALVKICRADGSPIEGFYLATVNVLERRGYRTAADGTAVMDYELDRDAEWLVVNAFNLGGISNANAVRDDEDKYHMMRRLREISKTVHVPGEFLIPKSILERSSDGVIEVRLPDPIVVKGSMRIIGREPEYVHVFGEYRNSGSGALDGKSFEIASLPIARSQRLYFQLRDGFLITRSIDAETAKSDVDLGIVELTVPPDPTHQIELSFRFPEPRTESRHANLPGITLVRTDGEVMYALRSLMDGKSYPLIKTQDRVIAGTYYLYPSWSFRIFPELEALVDAVLNGDDLSGYDLPTITVDENFKPQEIDVADCVKRFEPLLEAYRRKRLEDQPVTITVVPRGGDGRDQPSTPNDTVRDGNSSP